MAQQKAAAESKLLVTAVVLFYVFAALSMVVANKWVLNVVDAPLFFLFTQLVVAVLLFQISNFLRLLPDRLVFEFGVCKGLVPMVALTVVGLSSSNYTLKYVDASFYQVARGLVLPFTVLTSSVFLHSRPSLYILVACAIVTAGFFTGVFLDGTPISFKGIWFGIVSSAITAVHSVVIKKSLPVVKGSALALSWYTNLLSAIILGPLSIIAGELPAVLRLLGVAETLVVPGHSTVKTFLWGSAVTGILGFLMSIASLLSIKVTSPVTHMVSSAVRGVAASLLGMWLFHDIMTTGRAASIGIILAGSIYYTWLKNSESPPSSTSTSSSSDGSSTTTKEAVYERVKTEDNDLELGVHSKDKDSVHSRRD